MKTGGGRGGRVVGGGDNGGVVGFGQGCARVGQNERRQNLQQSSKV